MRRRSATVEGRKTGRKCQITSEKRAKSGRHNADMPLVRSLWLAGNGNAGINMLLDLVLRTTASSYPPRTILVDSRWDYLEPLVLRFLSQLHLQLCIYALFLLYLKEGKPRGRCGWRERQSVALSASCCGRRLAWRPRDRRIFPTLQTIRETFSERGLRRVGWLTREVA